MAGVEALADAHFDVRVVRWIDGYRAESFHEDLSCPEAATLYAVELLLPGELVVFDVEWSGWRHAARARGRGRA